MFEDIGENDGVEASPVQRVAHFVDLREVHLDHLLDAPPRHDHRIAARVDPHHTIAAALDVMRRGGEAACDVEHVAAAALAPETEETPVDILEVSVLLRFKHSRHPEPRRRRRISTSAPEILRCAQDDASVFAIAIALSTHTSLLM